MAHLDRPQETINDKLRMIAKDVLEERGWSVRPKSSDPYNSTYVVTCTREFKDHDAAVAWAVEQSLAEKPAR